MSWFKRHPILSAIIPFIILTLPSAINAYWDLYEKFSGVTMPSLNLGIAIWILPLIGLAFTVLIIWQVRKPIGSQAVKSASIAKITFHKDRNSLKLERGDLTELVRGSEYVWISCYTASSFEQSPILAQHKVTKLILYNPSYDLLKVYAAMEGDVNKVQAYRNNIISVTDDALKNNVPVYWASRPIINLMIANAESAKDEAKWAKVETFIPYRRADERPDYIITRKEYPELFDRLVKSFNAMLENKETTVDVMENRQVLEDAKRDFGWSLKST